MDGSGQVNYQVALQKWSQFQWISPLVIHLLSTRFNHHVHKIFRGLWPEVWFSGNLCVRNRPHRVHIFKKCYSTDIPSYSDTLTAKGNPYGKGKVSL